MNARFKPMLAVDADLDKLRLPCLASAKLDGIRAVVQNGVVLSRKLIEIPNRHVQRLFKSFEDHDGELIVGDPTSPTCYRDSMSGVMSRDGTPDVRFYVFDHVTCADDPYEKRLSRISARDQVVKHKQYRIEHMADLLMLEATMLDAGYEGLILRDHLAPYKYGRSTVKEGFLLKLKRFVDAEFEVVGFEERMANHNEATTDNLGRTKRSSHKENKTGRGDLGALVLKGDGFTFNCGTGFDDAERERIWQNRERYLGRLAKIKFFSVGGYDAPRHPTFLGWRDRIDV